MPTHTVRAVLESGSRGDDLVVHCKDDTTAQLFISHTAPLAGVEHDRPTIRRAKRGVVPPHSRLTPSSRTIFCKQSKLCLYRVSAPVDCIRVLMLSNGIVASAHQYASSRRADRCYVQTVMRPATAPIPKVYEDDSLPEAGWV